MNEEEVKKLAVLSRLELNDDEALEYAKDFDDIIKYIDTLKEASGEPDLLSTEVTVNRNVVREDINPLESGINTERILNEAPETKDDYIKVKKIL